jgi:hypothetical protein
MPWHFCNVLDANADLRRVWQFDARSEAFNLKGEFAARNGDALPPAIVAKSWGTILKSKLNVAWLPAENVFLRVAQFPASTPEETRAMVELQLEKLSPIPVTQALWTMIVLPKSAPAGEADKLQTIVVIIVARDVVEDFLGKLEGQGYMADRLELPMLDQLQATHIAGDGAWVYPETSNGITKHALVAWWYGGVLQNLALVAMEEGPGKIANLKDQLVQMAWAGELEGWLTAAPQWHFVGDTNDPWYGALREALEQPIDVVPPIPEQQLAAMTARRAARSDGSNNLLPPEFATRYQQQFVDRLWGRGLLAAFGIYLVCLAIYFVALTVFTQLTGRVEAQAVAISGSYTNSLQMRQMLNVLQDRDRLKFAALDCWEAVAEQMPTGLTLETMNFDGRTLSLRGTAPTDQVTAVTDFYDNLRRWKKNGKDAIFDTSGGDVPRTGLRDASTVNWSFELDLKQTGKK